MPKKMHDDEINITESLVKKLLHKNFPNWTNLPLTPIKSAGAENAIFKLGSEMCVRLPKIPKVANHIEIEQAYSLKLAPLLPLTIPTLLGKGNPNEDFPWHWSIYRWLEGEDAYVKKITNQHQAAIDLAQFLIALQRLDTGGAPPSYRGMPLATQDKAVRDSLKILHDSIDTQKAAKIWEECLSAPTWHKPPTWVHGDLIPANLLIKQDKLYAVIDFGSIGTGDPACDLIPAWSIFSREARNVFRQALSVDDATWMRGRGWALSIALIIIPYYQHSNPTLTGIAKRFIKEIFDEDEAK